jgi:hypothetical protein
MILIIKRFLLDDDVRGSSVVDICDEVVAI